MRQKFDAKDLIDYTATLPDGWRDNISFAPAGFKELHMRYPDRTETWVSDGEKFTKKLTDAELVQALADQLAQPWPEHVYKIHYNIDGNNCYISKDELEYEWWILPAALGGERNTLEEAARAVAEVIVNAKS